MRGQVFSNTLRINDMISKTRPLVTYCLFCYNQESYIEEALNSALSQDYDNLEIVVSDDCSRDMTYDIVLKIISNYKGSHTIITNRNKENLGVAAHFSLIMDKFVHGQYVVLAAGDDISFSNRVSRSISLMNEYHLNTITFNGDYIDKDGGIIHKRIYKSISGVEIYTKDSLLKHDKIRVHGASRCFEKNIYDYFGPLNRQSPTEDTTMTMRALLLGRVGTCYESILYYRTHGNNLSNSSNMLKMDYKTISNQYRDDIDKMKDLISNHDYDLLIEVVKEYENKARLFRLNKKDLFNPRLLFNLLFSNSFTAREKLSIIKRVIISGLS